MTEVNTVYGQGDTDLWHSVDAPPTTYQFSPTSNCGNAVLAGTLVSKSDLPKKADICASCEPSEQKDDAPTPKSEKHA